MRVLLFLLFIPLTSQAATIGKVAGFFGIITLSNRVNGVKVDDDPQKLFALMNVEPQKKPVGEGKNLRSSDKNLNLLCTVRPMDQSECSIVIKANRNSIISPQKIRYEITGEIAKELREKFIGDSDLNFQSDDEKFTLHASPDLFIVEFLP